MFNAGEEIMEETDVFRIVYYYDDSGIRWYRWYNFKKEDWEWSEKVYHPDDCSDYSLNED